MAESRNASPVLGNWFFHPWAPLLGALLTVRQTLFPFGDRITTSKSGFSPLSSATQWQWVRRAPPQLRGLRVERGDPREKSQNYIRAPQRSRTNRMCVCACAHIYRKVYGRELAHTVTEGVSLKICTWQAGDPGELTAQFPSESWQTSDPRRTKVSVQVQGRERPVFQLVQSGRRCSCHSAFLFYSDLPLTARGPSTLGTQNMTYLEYDFSVNLLQKHLCRHTQNIIWTNVWAPCSPMRLTRKIKYCKL